MRIAGAVALVAALSGVAICPAHAHADDTDPPAEAKVVRYVAVGDSYTCGEGATPADAWPAVLTRMLCQFGLPVRLVANPAVTGYTTQDALDKELPVYDASAPTFATLLIGVNDCVRRVPAETFHARLRRLLDRMQARLPQHDHLLIVTIPDYSVTRTGRTFGPPAEAAARIAAFNRILHAEAAKRRLSVVDVYTLSRRMASDPKAQAADGLHPSAAEYLRWARAIYPTVVHVLRPAPRNRLPYFSGRPTMED